MATKKIDYKRELRELYAPGGEPLIVDAPELAYVMIDGHGDPNTTDAYGAAIEALYAVAYSAKFAVKGPRTASTTASCLSRGFGGRRTCRSSRPRTSLRGTGP